MTYHIEAGRRRLLGSGQTAMEIFFVLSGFVITRSLLLEAGRIRLGRFYARRALRLTPALVVFMAVALMMIRIWRGAIPSNLLWMAGGALFYSSNIVLVRLRGGVEVFGGLWSLSIEEQFYLVWPLVLRSLTKGSRTRTYVLVAGAACLSLLSRVLRLSAGPTDNWYAYGTDPRALGLLLGCLGGLMSVWGVPWISKQPRVLLDLAAAAATAYLVGSALLVRSYVPHTFVTWWFGAPVASLVLITVLAHQTRTTASSVFGCRLLVGLGRISYSLYLWHFLVLSVLEPWVGGPRHLGEPTRYLALAALSIAIARLSYVVIERPFVRIGRTIGRGQEGSSTDEAPVVAAPDAGASHR